MSTTSENKSDSDTDGKSSQDGKHNVSPPDSNPTVKPQLIPGLGNKAAVAIELVAGTGCYVFGDDLQTWGHIFWGFFFHYLTLAFGSLLVANLIFAVWANRKWVLTCLTIWCLALACFYIRLSWPSKKTEPPPNPPVVVK